MGHDHPFWARGWRSKGLGKILYFPLTMSVFSRDFHNFSRIRLETGSVIRLAWAAEQIELTIGLQRDWGGWPCTTFLPPYFTSYLCIRLNFKNVILKDLAEKFWYMMGKISKSARPTFEVFITNFWKIQEIWRLLAHVPHDCWLMSHKLKFLQKYFMCS